MDFGRSPQKTSSGSSLHPEPKPGRERVDLLVDRDSDVRGERHILVNRVDDESVGGAARTSIDLADQPVIVQDRQRELSPDATTCRFVHLERSVELEQTGDTLRVGHQPVEWRMQGRATLEGSTKLIRVDPPAPRYTVDRRRFPNGYRTVELCRRDGDTVPHDSAGGEQTLAADEARVVGWHLRHRPEDSFGQLPDAEPLHPAPPGRRPRALRSCEGTRASASRCGYCSSRSTATGRPLRPGSPARSAGRRRRCGRGWCGRRPRCRPSSREHPCELPRCACRRGRGRGLTSGAASTPARRVARMRGLLRCRQDDRTRQGVTTRRGRRPVRQWW